MTWTQPTRCELCGSTERHSLRFALVHWRDAPPGMSYASIEACIDREACRARVAEMGDEWPLVDTPKRKAS